MNNKGYSLALVILVISAFSLSVFSFAIFFSSEKEFSSGAESWNQLFADVQFNEEYVKKSALIIGKMTLSQCSSCSEIDFAKKFMEIAASREGRYSGAGNFFGKVRSGEFSVKRNSGKYIVIIPEVSVSARIGLNKIRRTFDVIVELQEKN